MNPFTFLSNISRNKNSNRSNVDIIKETLDDKPFYKSPEIVALLVFAGIYILIRLIETYITPLIPEFLTKEVSSLYRWGPILVPIIFGITYFSKTNSPAHTTMPYGTLRNKTTETSENILKERMMAWAK